MAQEVREGAPSRCKMGTTRSSCCLLAFLLGGLADCVFVASAATPPSNPLPNNNNNNNNGGSHAGGGGRSHADFFFSLSLDLSSDGGSDEEDDEEADFVRRPPECKRISGARRSGQKKPPAATEEDEDMPGSGYGGCYVSAQALMCQGGGGAGDADEALANPDAKADGNNDSEDEDDDEDDDNDGHSSMLSNASLRRARRSHADPSGWAGSVGSHEGGAADPPFVGRRAAPATASARSSALAKTATALSIRGGAGAAGGTGTAGILQSQAARNLLVTALVTLVFEGSIGHILEFLKIVKQTAVVDASYWRVLGDITRSKGVAGLWDGFCPWGVVQAVFKGAVFGLAYQLALNAMRPLVDGGWMPPAAALTLAGGVGGGLQGYVLSPTLLLKTRVMTNPVFRERMSVLRTTRLSVQIGYDVCATEGLVALMKGSNVFALKRVFDWSSRYLFSDLFESLILARKSGAPLTVAEKSAASLLGGVFSTCVTLPLDVLVAKTQDAKKAGVRVSAVRLFRDELKERGWAGLQKAYMQGFEARLLHVCLTTLGTIVLTVFLPPLSVSMS